MATRLSAFCLTAWSVLACGPQTTAHNADPSKHPDLDGSADVRQEDVAKIDPYADILVNAEALQAAAKRATEHGRFLSIDVESFAFGEHLGALERWQLEPLRGLGETLRNNAQNIMRADSVASTEGIQTLHVRPTILLSTDRYVTIAQQIDILERSQGSLGKVRSARCATIRRSDGRLLVKADILLPRAPSRTEERGGDENVSACLVKRGVWLLDDVFNSPVMGEDDTSRVTPGNVVPYEMLSGSIRGDVLPLSSRSE